MSEKIYRQKALSKINSPEELNEIICVTNPGVWLILTALLVLLLGALCWGFLGEIETTIPVTYVNQDGRLVTTMSMNEPHNIQVGTPARVLQHPCNVSAVRIDENSNTLEIEVNVTYPDIGHISGEIITGYLHPIDFLLN